MDDRQRTTGDPEPGMTRQAFRRQQQQQATRGKWDGQADPSEPPTSEPPLRRSAEQDPEVRHRRLARKLDLVIVLLIILIIAVLCVMRFVD